MNELVFMPASILSADWEQKITDIRIIDVSGAHGGMGSAPKHLYRDRNDDQDQDDLDHLVRKGASSSNVINPRVEEFNDEDVRRGRFRNPFYSLSQKAIAALRNKPEHQALRNVLNRCSERVAEYSFIVREAIDRIRILVAESSSNREGQTDWPRRKMAFFRLLEKSETEILKSTEQGGSIWGHLYGVRVAAIHLLGNKIIDKIPAPHANITIVEWEAGRSAEHLSNKKQNDAAVNKALRRVAPVLEPKINQHLLKLQLESERIVDTNTQVASIALQEAVKVFAEALEKAYQEGERKLVLKGRQEQL